MEYVLSLLLAFHLMCVNVAAGGPIVAAWLDWRSRKGDNAAARAAKSLAAAAVVGLMLGSLFGIAIGWLKWTPDYANLWLGRLRYKLDWGIAELLFSLLLMVGHWLWLPGKFPPQNWRRWSFGVRTAIALLTTTNLLYHFPPLFSVAARLHTAREIIGPPARGALFRQWMFSGETPPLSVHVALASIAMAGMILLVMACRWTKELIEAERARVAVWGAWWALGATLLQLPVGLWLLVMLPANVQTRLMGADTVATLAFLIAILAVLWLMRDLVNVALGDTTRGSLLRSLSAMGIVILLMTVMQQRAARVEPAASALSSNSTGVNHGR